jgi:hypothetical protein
VGVARWLRDDRRRPAAKGVRCVGSSRLPDHACREAERRRPRTRAASFRTRPIAQPGPLGQRRLGQRGGTAVPPQQLPERRPACSPHLAHPAVRHTWPPVRPRGRLQREIVLPAAAPKCVGIAWAPHVVPPPVLAQDGSVPERTGRRPGPAGLSDLPREESPMRTLRTTRRHSRYPPGSPAAFWFGGQLNEAAPGRPAPRYAGAELTAARSAA